MSIYLGGGSNEKLSRLYKGSDLMVGGGCGYTVKYSPNFNSPMLISVDGYKIKEITFDLEFNYSGSAWGKPQFLIKNAQSSPTRVAIFCCQFGNQWGYNYGEGITYGGFREWEASNTLVSFSSSSTTKSNGSFTVTIGKNGLTYSAGKYYGTWLESGSPTYNSTRETSINEMFNSQTLYMSRDNGGANNVATWTKYDATITYEAI